VNLRIRANKGDENCFVIEARQTPRFVVRSSVSHGRILGSLMILRPNVTLLSTGQSWQLHPADTWQDRDQKAVRLPGLSGGCKYESLV
jgi:hypothetical protein